MYVVTHVDVPQLLLLAPSSGVTREDESRLRCGGRGDVDKVRGVKGYRLYRIDAADGDSAARVCGDG